MKTVTTTILVVTLLIGVACGEQAQSSQERRQPSEPPDVGLHLAALMGNTDAIRQHIEAGSDLNEKDAYGSTPLIVAVTFGKTDVAMALIEGGADVDMPNTEGATPLGIAAVFCRTEIVGALLDRGADPYLRDNGGKTPQDAVAAPFEDVQGIYDVIAQGLAPLGLQLDYERIRVTRPRIAEMLRPLTEDLEAVEYAPLPSDGWEVSTPAEQGLDPMLVAELYLGATQLSNLYGLLVIKNGHLIAEGYFNVGSVEQLSGRQSVTKSYTSALVGVALDQGHLSSVDQKMVEFFPELAGQIEDPRKEQITIRDLLQMRAGYPDEEHTPPYFDLLFFSDNWHHVPHLVDFPLTGDPGTEFAYSNLTSHLLAVIAARACDSDLESYAQEHLFTPINAKVGGWSKDADNYNLGALEIYVTARDMAKFGLLYLNDGHYEGNQVVSADWVRESLQRYSEGLYDNEWRGEPSRYLGPYFRDVGYGYQWWSARVGDHNFDYAWGHGGQLIILLDEFDMIIVTTADPLYGPELAGQGGWRYEGAIINLVGKFIKSLPTE